MSESAFGQGLVEELGEERAAEIMEHLHAEIAKVVKAETARCVGLLRVELRQHEEFGDPSHIEATAWAIKALEGG